MPPTPIPPTVDFDSADYDALTTIGTERLLQSCLEDVFRRFNLALADHQAINRAAEDAVDSCITSCLEVIAMQYPAREDDPVSAISLQNNSWDVEQPPAPCAVDSWLRGALPDTAPTAGAGGQSWAMQQFLGQQAGAPSAHGPMDDLQANQSSGSVGSSHPPAQQLKHHMSTSSRSTMLGGVSRSSIHTTKIATRQLTPEEEHIEEQLRQELQQRKQQEELRGRLQQKDAEERVKLATLRKELKGKDYTYDHKGEVVILNDFDPDKTPLESLSGPAYKVAAPSDDPNRTLSPKRRNTLRSASYKSLGGVSLKSMAAPPPPVSTGATLSPSEMRKERERRLANDYRKAPAKTQPSAMDVMHPAGGVTLRQGGASKSGPMKPLQAGLTREAYQKQIAKKAAAERQAAAAAAAAAAGHGPLSTIDGAPWASAPSGMGMGMGMGLMSRSMLAGPSTSTAAVIAAARAAIQMERDGDPLSAYSAADSHRDVMRDARPRRQEVLPKPMTPPDVNLALTGAGDWGTGAGGRGFEPPPALHAAKPTERQLVETVGRTARLPRERAAVQTLQPPLSPTKAGQQKDTSRLQFHSMISG